MKCNQTTIRSDTTERHTHKYANKNIIHQLVLGRFLDVMAREISAFKNLKILDFGCGESFFWREMARRGLLPEDLTGVDLRDDALDTSRSMFPQYKFIKQDLLSWQSRSKFDLVIASQVLEHLPRPERFLEKLLLLTRGQLLLTVPWEPFFRLTNLIRGRDILQLGNHPEHINHWNFHRFKRFVASHADIVKSGHVFPFLFVICKPKFRSARA